MLLVGINVAYPPHPLCVKSHKLSRVFWEGWEALGGFWEGFLLLYPYVLKGLFWILGGLGGFSPVRAHEYIGEECPLSCACVILNPPNSPIKRKKIIKIIS
jgi:hypothetical protein